jgi:hypothetical protein
MGPLTVYGQSFTMPKTSITAQIHQALNVHRNFTPQIAFDFVFAVNDPADAGDLVVGQVIAFDAELYPSLGQNSLSAGTAKTEDIGQGNLYTLLAG